MGLGLKFPRGSIPTSRYSIIAQFCRISRNEMKYILNIFLIKFTTISGNT